MANKHFLNWIERQGQNLRNFLRLGPIAPLDPYQLAPCLKARIFAPTDVINISLMDLDQLLEKDAGGWSAGSIRLPWGEIAIVVNPTHAETRKRASLMEEFSHIYLNHSPSEVIIGESFTFRTFKKSQETQAYWVGSAALVPRNALERAKTRNASREVVANHFGVSQELITFREKVTGVKLH